MWFMLTIPQTELLSIQHNVGRLQGADEIRHLMDIGV
jgi:hypothetical protein